MLDQQLHQPAEARVPLVADGVAVDRPEQHRVSPLRVQVRRGDDAQRAAARPAVVAGEGPVLHPAPADAIEVGRRRASDAPAADVQLGGRGVVAVEERHRRPVGRDERPGSVPGRVLDPRRRPPSAGNAPHLPLLGRRVVGEVVDGRRPGRRDRGAEHVVRPGGQWLQLPRARGEQIEPVPLVEVAGEEDALAVGVPGRGDAVVDPRGPVVGPDLGQPPARRLGEDAPRDRSSRRSRGPPAAVRAGRRRATRGASGWAPGARAAGASARVISRPRHRPEVVDLPGRAAADLVERRLGREVVGDGVRWTPRRSMYCSARNRPSGDQPERAPRPRRCGRARRRDGRRRRPRCRSPSPRRACRRTGAPPPSASSQSLRPAPTRPSARRARPRDRSARRPPGRAPRPCRPRRRSGALPRPRGRAAAVREARPASETPPALRGSVSRRSPLPSRPTTQSCRSGRAWSFQRKASSFPSGDQVGAAGAVPKSAGRRETMRSSGERERRLGGACGRGDEEQQEQQNASLRWASHGCSGPAPALASARLVRSIGLVGLTATGIASMVGAGIYVVPFMIQRHVPGIGSAVLLAYLLAAVPAVLAGLAYAILASAMPRAGGSYVYASRGLSPYLGFIASFSQWFSLCVAIGVVCYLLDAVRARHRAGRGRGRRRRRWLDGPGAAWLLPLAVPVVFAGVNLRGLETYERVLVPLHRSSPFSLGAVVIVAGFSFGPGRLPQRPALRRRAVAGDSGRDCARPAQPRRRCSSPASSGSTPSPRPEARRAIPSRTLPLAIGLADRHRGRLLRCCSPARCITPCPGPYVRRTRRSGTTTSAAPGCSAPCCRRLWTVAMVAGAAVALVKDLPAMLLGVSRLMFAWAEDGIVPGRRRGAPALPHAAGGHRRQRDDGLAGHPRLPPGGRLLPRRGHPGHLDAGELPADVRLGARARRRATRRSRGAMRVLPLACVQAPLAASGGHRAPRRAAWWCTPARDLAAPVAAVVPPVHAGLARW